ncbi:hypothetical protein B0I37DRAFT_143104 [Chaetomium sp. MPI-CAGE-AT-0009]|nr:hypothetical protein B0I37DRAFT_143104 [Chaetomium sp. MPI-CAGE-AT-0009]
MPSPLLLISEGKMNPPQINWPTRCRFPASAPVVQNPLRGVSLNRLHHTSLTRNRRGLARSIYRCRHAPKPPANISSASTFIGAVGFLHRQPDYHSRALLTQSPSSSARFGSEAGTGTDGGAMPCPWQVRMWEGRGFPVWPIVALLPLSHGLVTPSACLHSAALTWLCPFPQGPETPLRFLLLHC